MCFYSILLLYSIILAFLCFQHRKHAYAHVGVCPMHVLNNMLLEMRLVLKLRIEIKDC